MADKNNKKEPTPPPLLLMPASEGLTLSAPAGSNILMPVPHVDPNLFQPEDGEADSFLGQTPPQQPPVTYFQPPSNSSTPDPFAQVSQPDPSIPAPTIQAVQNDHTLEGSPVPPNIPVSGSAVPSASVMPQTFASVQPGGGQPSQFRMQGGGGLKRAQYAQPPPGTYAQDGMMQPGGFPMMPPEQAPPSFVPPTSTPFSGAPPAQYNSPPMPQDTFGGPTQSASMPNIATHPQGPPMATPYIPIHHHWFYCKNIELRQMWKPFSIVDSVRLEEAFRAGVHDNLILSTDGGRYDVDVSERTRTPVYWDETPNKVRRCSWFYRPEGDNRCVPYEEDFSARLEEEYKNALVNDIWHKRLEFPGGETIVMHNPNVIVHFRPSSQPDEWGTTQVSPTKAEARPRVVKRGVDEFDEIADGEPSQIDHVVFVVHGIGPTCDLRFRSIIECVDDFRNLSHQIIGSHFKQYSEEGRIGRVEFLPVRWHAALHNDATGVDRKLKAITLNSIGKLRNFTNDTLVDILFYTSPQYAQTIVDTVSGEINRLFQLFLNRNPEFRGAVSVSGHSLGSLILFDLLRNQRDPNAPPEAEPPKATPDISPVQSREETPVKDNGDASENGGEDEEMSLEALLEKLGLSNYAENFQKEQIDMETLTMCEESDIKEMGLPMGPRKKLQTFIKDRKKKHERKGAELALASQLEAQRKLQEEQQSAAEAAASQAVGRSISNTSVNYVCGEHGTGALDIAYPQLDFSPVNFFALGSPVGMFLTVRGQENLGENFKLPTCNGYFNIFHPFDPVAYRLEPLISHSYPAKAVLMPHHKGRKRLHLELREGLTRIGADMKAKIMDSLKSTWKTINDFALAHRSTPESIEEEVNSVVTQMTHQDEDHEDAASITSSMVEDEGQLGSINQGRRVDYVLQEAPIESFNDYLFALGSHACYWESEDTVLMVLKEIYGLMGFAPQRPGQEPAVPQLYRRDAAPSPPGAGMSPHFPPTPGQSAYSMAPPAPMSHAQSPVSMATPSSYMGAAPQMAGAPPPQFNPGMPPPMTGFVRK